MKSQRLYFKVFGQVQGIGFRWFIRSNAEKLSLIGWVRNVSDGAVEGEVQGEEEKIKLFLKNLREEHPFANVREIKTGKAELGNECRFYIKHTK